MVLYFSPVKLDRLLDGLPGFLGFQWMETAVQRLLMRVNTLLMWLMLR